MKCRACWADKAFVREVRGWRGVLLKCFLLTPLKCHHCYHKFTVPWLLTLGKPLSPPSLRIAAGTQSSAGAAATSRTDAAHDSISRPRHKRAA